MTAPMVDYKIHWLKMMSVPESRAVVGRHDGINGRDSRLALPGEDVEHDVGAAGAAVERLGTGPTASSPSSSTAARILTNCLSPSSQPVSRARMRPSAPGSCQPLKGAPFLSAPGFRVRIGT